MRARGSVAFPIHISQHVTNMAYHRLAAVLLGTGALLAHFGCTAQKSIPEYSIKFENPPIGSHIRRDAMRGSPIPINRSYHELTPEQRATVHRWYENIAPVSWWITRHVEDGRRAMNFSTWRRLGVPFGDAADLVKNGSMPPGYYTRFGLGAGLTRIW